MDDDDDCTSASGPFKHEPQGEEEEEVHLPLLLLHSRRVRRFSRAQVGVFLLSTIPHVKIETKTGFQTTWDFFSPFL